MVPRVLTRVLDPRDGKPRDPAFWLVVAALGLAQLLALWGICAHQVRKAEVRRAEAQVQQLAASDCLRYRADATIGSCAGSQVATPRPRTDVAMR